MNCIMTQSSFSKVRLLIGMLYGLTFCDIVEFTKIHVSTYMQCRKALE